MVSPREAFGYADVEEDELRLCVLGEEYVAWVDVAVDEVMLEYHLADRLDAFPAGTF